MSNNRTPIWIGAGAVAIAALILLYSSVYVIDERQQAVILQFGKPVASRTEPGLYFKLPFIQEVRRLPKTLRFWRSEGESLTDLPTADGKKVEVSAWAVWRITEPKNFVKNLGSLDNGEAAVMVRVRSALRDVITAHDLEEVVRSTDRELTYSFQDLISDLSEDVEQPPEVTAAQPGVSGEVSFGRQEILELVEENVTRQLKKGSHGEENDRGVELVEVGISHIGFVPRVREAAFERQIAFMESIAAGYTNAGLQRKQEIINAANAEVERLIGEGEKEAEIIRGQADAENIRKYAAAIKETGDFYRFVRTLGVYENALQGQTRLILTTDSELLGLLKGLRPAKFEPTPPKSAGTVAVEAPR